MRPFIDQALCIFAATIAGALVGLNRDLHGKPTGARLHALVAIGAAAFTLAGTEMADKAARGSSAASVFWVPARSCGARAMGASTT